MSTVLKLGPMNFDAYLSWEAEQAERHEFVAGEVYAMTDARAMRNTIALNLAMMLRQALRESPCRVFIADMELRITPANASFYPDVFVTCDPRDRAPEAELAQRFPTLVVEVLSNATAAFDRGRKFECYWSIDTLTSYPLVEQDRVHADLFERNAEGRWVLNSVGEGGSVSIGSLAVELKMSAVYDGVCFGAEPPTSAAA